MDVPSIKNPEKIKLVEINPYLTCYLCKGYLIDATTISECLHSFCRSCIIKFLQENSHCPVCEVMINKAKPNIKPDKTLQDIVYKLVPELFLREMLRRQRFYRAHPIEATKTTPEERGEDTERTIFSPSDTISLSIEYISDDSTPGAIVVPSPPPSTAVSTVVKNVKNGGEHQQQQDTTIRRFLQCPGMCRVDVLKKFVRNKYNVDTNRFYIDVLYKKVPLPDHYTLIDIAYIYSWKRNEPMKFFFRITDINKVTERFDYLGPKPPQPVPETKNPPIITEVAKEEKPVKTVKFSIPEKKNRQSATKKPIVTRPTVPINPPPAPVPIISEVPSTVDTNKEISEIKNRIQQELLNEKNPVYTNITLNRSNNVEIITKIQKVSNKNGQPIGLNIKKTVIKSKPVPAVVEAPKPAAKIVEEVAKKEKEDEPILPAPVPMEIDLEKSNFLKSIELTAKNSLSPQKSNSPQNPDPTPKPSPSPKKRKNLSPVKTDQNRPPKKTKVLKLTKPIPLNPAVRQIVSNVNQSATNVTKIVERNAPSKDLQTLFDNCKINIPSSLSITLKESGDGGGSGGGGGGVGGGESRTPGPVKPVQNFIEIVRLPDVKEEKHSPRSPQTFQKMFEETIKKPEFTKLLTPRNNNNKTNSENSDGKRKNNIAEIAQQLYKKTKIEQGSKNGKVKTPPPPPTTTQQSIDCHSASLGMNYKVSVGHQNNGAQSPNKIVSSSTVSPPPNNKSVVLPKPTSSLSITTTSTTTNNHHNHHHLSPDHILEKYNIQNLAQLTASFNLNPANLAMSQQAGQLAALQQAMILKHIEMQNRQNWYNMNPTPLVQYEKYLQSLQGQSHLVGKEN